MHRALLLLPSSLLLSLGKPKARRRKLVGWSKVVHQVHKALASMGHRKGKSVTLSRSFVTLSLLIAFFLLAENTSAFKANEFKVSSTSLVIRT